ncbi:MAG: COG3942 and LysM peptidoglycan-binding domain-containing protein [Candidatus Dormibacteria bacterium]
MATQAADRQQLMDRGFILKPTAATVASVRPEIQTYSVQQGDTLLGIADRFGISLDSLRWANNISDLTGLLALDQKLMIPPVNGVLVTVQSGDTLAGLASRYQASAAAIQDFNLLRDPDNLVPGTQLMIPDGVGAGVTTAPPAIAPSAPVPARRASGSIVTGVQRYSGVGNAHFPYGYCTWYVSTKRNVPWMGDARQWFGNAQAYGYATGQTPRVGAIMVTRESGWGHVGYVEAVDGSCWTVSEMNYRGFGIVDTRHVCPGQVPLIGFIY